MSSACVCHTDEWCFYCEMYEPLRRGIEKTIAELEEKSLQHGKKYTNKWEDDRRYHLGVEDGLDTAIDRLKAVLKHETRSQHNPNGSCEDDRTGQMDKPNS